MSASRLATRPPIQYGIPQAEYEVSAPDSNAMISSASGPFRRRACEAAELSNPSKPGTWPGFIEKGREVTPVQKMGLPEIERIGGNCAPVLKLCTLSATLPAHPAAVIPESCAVCHWSC